ncbi:MAG TPA: hypothetical protein VHY18_03370 [Solirubrobacteraceae bacterium]|nr:hypothetical protein [Solirubrobacteraceae bacterium]
MRRVQIAEIHQVALAPHDPLEHHQIRQRADRRLHIIDTVEFRPR